MSGGIDTDEALYRPLTQRSVGDLDSYTRDKMLDISLYLDRTNPVARRMLDLIRDFVFAEGMRRKYVNRDVERELERHWNDPINKWEERGPRLFRQLMRDGEVLLVRSVNPVDGFVRWGSLPSRVIDSVNVDPNNHEIVRSIRRKREPNEDQGKLFQAIGPNLETGRYEGEALLWKLNDDGEGTRGISFLYPLADMLDVLEETIFNEMERQQLLKAFLIDVTVTGADESKIDRMKRDPMYASPKPGSVWMHNENIDNKMLTPDLKASDFVSGMEFFLNFALGGAGIPLHWYGFGGDANRATATTMDEPTIKMLTQWQNVVECFLETALRYVVDQLVAAGTLPETVEEQDSDGAPVKDDQGNPKMILSRDAFDIQPPEMDTTDIAQVGNALHASARRC